MKKNFTLLAFLVVTVNAAAQYNGYLNVGDPYNSNGVSYGLQNSTQTYGERGIIDKDRLNVCGYNFFKHEGWNWIDGSGSNMQGTSKSWDPTGVFKGSSDFFSSTSYVSYNFATNATKKAIFYIKNCTGIDLFLERFDVTTDEDVSTFSIKAYPSTKDNPSSSNDFSSVAEKTDEVILDKNEKRPFTSSLSLVEGDNTINRKIYKIEITVPAKTYLYEVSFRISKYKTTIGNSNWGTMYLDFPATIPNDDLKVYTVNGVVDNRCAISPITGSIPANTGVLLYEPDTNHNEIEFVETGEPTSSVEKGILRGTVAENFTVGNALENMPAYKVLTLGKIDDKVGFYIYKNNQSDAVLNPYKAYLLHKYSSSNNGEVKGIYISGFDELTEIQMVENESTELGNWYSLQGVRLNARPTQRGIYLNNGKKVLVK